MTTTSPESQDETDHSHRPQNTRHGKRTGKRERADHTVSDRANHARVVYIGGTGARQITLADVAAVARDGTSVRLANDARARIAKAHAFIEAIIAENRTVYGVTTGFGRLNHVKIAPDQVKTLQRNLIRSHASGVGEPFDIPTARAIMLTLANSLARGHSGVRQEVIELLIGMLNHDVTPVIPMRGSVGASGDLAPLSHLGLLLFGEGEAWHARERLPGDVALARAGLTPLELDAKEGLAINNGTHVMEACGALAITDAWRLVRAAEVAVAMSIEALAGNFVPLDARIHAIRPQRGQGRTAARLRALLVESEINANRDPASPVQDPYTLRCAPQVLGAARDALAYCEGVFAVELEAVTDNPLLFPEDGEMLTGGNFHGQPLAL
ncbi:MAG TPA: aromatic amino acid lyase, partial [Ktedonobacterales bacterium]|nr:aromatic amino acid lyase [Ktedonobacterales bacterium]